jgi:hypothetical protein
MKSSLPEKYLIHGDHREGQKSALGTIVGMGKIFPKAKARLDTVFRKVASRPSLVAALLCLPLLVYFYGFLLMSRFGIYDDDYVYILPWMGASFKDLVHFTTDLAGLQAEGRLLGNLFTGIISFIFDRTGHIETSYLGGWLIISANAILIFLLLRRCAGITAGFLVAVFYIVFPADTSRTILMHRVFLNLTLTMILGGLMLYQRQKRGAVVLSYLLAGASLLSYESFYLLFGLAPLLTRDQFRWRKLIIHLTVMGVILAVVLGLRVITGESRSLELAGGLGENIPKMFQAMYFGAATALIAYPLRALDSMLHSNPANWLVILIAGLSIASVLICFKLESARLQTPSSEPGTGRWLTLFAGAVLVTFGAYILHFRPTYFPPITVIGRLSGVHCAAALGAAMVAGLLFERLLSAARMSTLAIIAAAGFPALLFGFGLQIQNDEYANGWDREKEFWNVVCENIGDVKEGDFILVDLLGNDAPIGFPAWWVTGAGNPGLHKFVQFPSSWKSNPKIFGYFEWMPHHAEGNAIVLDLPGVFPPEEWPRIDDGKFILFGYKDGVLRRISEKSVIFGKEFWPKPAGNEKAPVLTRLGRTLLRSHGESNWFTLRGKTAYPRIPIWDFDTR